MPESFDISKLQTEELSSKEQIQFTINTTAMMYTNRQEIRDIMDKIEGDSHWKKTFDTLLRSGN